MKPKISKAVRAAIAESFVVSRPFSSIEERDRMHDHDTVTAKYIVIQWELCVCATANRLFHFATADHDAFRVECGDLAHARVIERNRGAA